MKYKKPTEDFRLGYKNGQLFPKMPYRTFCAVLNRLAKRLKKREAPSRKTI